MARFASDSRLDVFWPLDVKLSGYCYGWLEPVVCVVGVIPVQSRDDAKGAIQTLLKSERWRHLKEHCGDDPRILGTCAFNDRAISRPNAAPTLVFDPPIDRATYAIIYYCRPRMEALRYYSLGLAPTPRTTMKNGLAAAVGPAQKRRVPSCLDMLTIERFNCAQTLDDVVSPVTGPRKRKLRPTISSTIWHRAWLPADSSLLASVQVAIYGLTSSFPVYPVYLLQSVLAHASATVQQCSVRAEQISSMPAQVRTLYRDNNETIHDFSTRYVAFYNVVWLILNDIIVGTALGAFICENHEPLADLLQEIVTSFLIRRLNLTLLWLDDWPAGLKLNTELSRFACNTFVAIISSWGYILNYAIPYFPSILYAIGCMGYGGMTLINSLLTDLLGFLTVHLYVCYYIAATIYRQQLGAARSLWNLFRGKRYNVLRRRIDPWEYDIDQLLLGTILFTLVAFLFPTIVTYYALFATMQLCLVLVRATLEMFLAFMNHFPLFALMLRVKDPWRLPGGIVISTVMPFGASEPVRVIKNQPLTFGYIFYHFTQPVQSRLSSHYNAHRLLRHVLSGDYLTAMPRYSVRDIVLQN